MKRLYFLMAIFAVFTLSAQVVTTNPTIVVQQTGVGVTITFNVSSITALAGNPGPLYVHTGVLTTASVGSGDWRYVFTPWPTGTNGATANTAKNQLTAAGTNMWTLTIPDLNTYYGITSGEVITQLAFVVRTADGSKQSADLFVPVYPPGLNVSITSPANNTLITASAATTSITAYASNGGQSCTTSIYVGVTTNSNITGTTPVGSGTNTGTTPITGSYVFNTAGSYYIIAKTTSGSLNKSDTSYVCVASSTQQTDTQRPPGLKEGITKNPDGSVTFCLSLAVPAGGAVGGATKVYLLGDFNGFRLDNSYLMNKDIEGATVATNPNGENTYFFWITIPGLDPNTEYAYQYYVTGLTNATNNNASVRVGDPYCEKILDQSNDKYINQNYTIYPNLRVYPSALASGILSCFKINDQPYQWQTTSFTPPNQNDLNIYEMLFRDFTPEGSVQAAIGKLDYLKSLGINAVELMPIMEFDGNNSWGYNPNYYFAPDKAYGTKADYQQFVDECHKRGIAVILDIVLNHTWGLSPYCMVYWDATNNRPLSTNPYYNAVAPHPYSVGNDIKHSSPSVKVWLKRALQFWLTEYKVDGYRYDLSKGFTQTSSTDATVSNYDQARINNIEAYVDAVKAANPNAYNILEHFCAGNEEDALAAYKNTMLWRNMNYAYCQAAMCMQAGSDFSGMVGTNRVGYAESHDEYRMGYKAITWGSATNIASEMQQLAACGVFVFMEPGPRMMWEFGELGADYQSKDASGNNLMDRMPALWGNLNVPERVQLHDVYTKVLNFRQQYSSLFINPTTWNWQVSQNDWANGRRIFLQNSDITAVVVANFNCSNTVTSYPAFGQTGTWYELLSGSTLNVTDPNMTLALSPSDVRIYTNVMVSTNIKNVTKASVMVYPNPVVDYLYISGGNAVAIEVDAMTGARMLNEPVSGNAVLLTSLPAGIYVGKITFSDGSLKIVKISKK